MHRLRRVRSGVPGVGHLRARRPAGEVEELHRDQRQVFLKISPNRSRSRTRGDAARFALRPGARKARLQSSFKMPLKQTEAIVLRTYPMREADLLVTLFT